jgi:quercetin 2,3-dioxygenase
LDTYLLKNAYFTLSLDISYSRVNPKKYQGHSMSITSNNQKTIAIRKAEERGHANHGWLNSYHTFSFANYYDPNYMGFRSLRVINEDRVLGGKGFGTHPHRDMEIISYVIEGAMEHKDTIGNSCIIRPGDVQRMSAGTGIAHSEFNYSPTEQVHFLQIWILPNQTNLVPSYEQKFFTDEEKENQLCLIVSNDGRDGSLKIHQDMNLYAAKIHPHHRITYSSQANRHLWIQVVKGEIEVENHQLQTGDAAAISDAESINIIGQNSAEILLFDLA